MESPWLTPGQVALVRTTWKLARGRGSVLAGSFYGRLFQIAPQTRGMFKDLDMAAQGRKFAEMLDKIVAGIEDQNVIAREVSDLGRRHAEYGVKFRDYPVVGQALIHALDRELGEALTLEARQAWLDAYRFIAELMLRGASAG